MAVLLLIVLACGCGSSSTGYLLSGVEGYHPMFGHLSWFDRSVFVVIRVPRASAVGLEFPDKVILCFTKVGNSLSFSSVAKDRPTKGCSVYAPADILGYGSEGSILKPSDPLLIKPDFRIVGPWFNRDAQRYDPGVIKDISLDVQIDDDGKIASGKVNSVKHRPGRAFAPK